MKNDKKKGGLIPGINYHRVNNAMTVISETLILLRDQCSYEDKEWVQTHREIYEDGSCEAIFS